ncbi:MAG TPA: hypothetical protein ENI23_12840 [bacterium]|nr:hypothetical protein [bacterium]
MVVRTEILSRPKGGLYNQFDEVEDVATTSAFVTALDIDLRAVRESVVIIHNVTAGDLDYQILANARDFSNIVAPTGTNDDDKGWVSLQSASIASGAIPAIETLSNPYTRMVIQIKHTTATTDVSIWHRGES